MSSPSQPKTQKQINLLRGWPHASLLPTAAITNAAQTALTNPSISTPGLLYGPDAGYEPLREEIASWLSGFNSGSAAASTPVSGPADPDRICITGGASQNLACVLQVYSDPGYTRVWMVAPCYFLACRIFADSGLKMAAVGEGKDGVDLEGLEKKLQEAEGIERKKLKTPKPWSKTYRNIIYCVPTFSNPSGKTMTLPCRKSLVQLARKYDALIITDDVYDFLQWPTTATSSIPASNKTTALLPRLVDVDRTLDPIPSQDGFGNTVSNGSFSKIAGPGTRTGWAEASPKFTYGLSQCGSSRSGGAPSQLTATIVCELLRSGELGRHIEGVLVPAYQRRYGALMDAIQRWLVPLGVTVGEVSSEGGIFGGFFVWVEMPAGVDSGVVARRAKEREGLVVAPGSMFEVEGDDSVKFDRGVRLCFAWVEEEELAEGVERLGRVVREITEEGVTGRVDEGELGVDLGEFR
ncbi:uncharacterized protein BP5553_04323 [Venustampulla echinocandica]|uniref:Aminotransferase class I/classII large domain-containing protein n=1 Tax=Venustampulla echinocandica TaxID=2656787 RepID=A0A370TWT3_9HELO|nr:uncharacterized protein BP5553_04323 [Venustampulla echinocandica]RDL39983.1 hypothetical protein BP5553_04323 [Venustampulla echinocandica]